MSRSTKAMAAVSATRTCALIKSDILDEVTCPLPEISMEERSMKWLLCFVFSTFLMFGVSYVPSVTLAQTDDHAQPPAVDDRAPTPEDRNPAGGPPPDDDATPPDENEGMMVPEVGDPTDEPPPEDDISPPEG
jgi:hypothetical protein